MTSRRMWTAAVALGIAAGCTATNTGNPNGPSAPEGVELIRSTLERQEPSAPPADVEAFGQGSRDFALALYEQAGASADGNLFVSPYSALSALAMTYAGAVGQTESEMASALRLALPEPDVHAALNATDRALHGRVDELAGDSEEMPSTGQGFELRVVNATFGQRGTEFGAPFLDTLALHYGAGVYAADFAGNPERERMVINDWVMGQTNDRIQDLLPQGSIDPSVVMVLVNAMYFRASWLEPFDPEMTTDQVFHAPSGDVTVPTIHGHAERYAEGEGYKALELPYISDAVRMLFILPDEGRFDEIEQGLDRAFVDGVTGALSRYSVQLSFPRFSFEYELELSAAMQALGMELAFEPGAADLSDIALSPGQLYVDAIYHKTFVAVDEQGTEAAAATAVVVGVVSAPPPAEFFADRPFIFLIYDEPTGQILFIGRVLDPS